MQLVRSPNNLPRLSVVLAYCTVPTDSLDTEKQMDAPWWIFLPFLISDFSYKMRYPLIQILCIRVIE